MEDRTTVGRRSHVMRIAALLCACIIVTMVVGKGVSVLHQYQKRSQKRAHIRAREAALRQVLTAMQQYASASPGHYYPPRSAEPGAFLPDFGAWEKGAPDKAAFEQAKKTLTDPNQPSLCYTGYAFLKDFQAMQLLDAIEKDPMGTRGGGPTDVKDTWIGSAHDPDVDRLHPLRDGVQCQFSWSFEFHGNPPTKERLGENLPVLWEMPRKEGEEAMTVYMAGSVNRNQYPSSLPLSLLFVNRMRALMGLPQDAGFCSDGPLVPLAKLIERVSGSCLSLDAYPSVMAGDWHGYRLRFSGLELVLFPEDTAATTLPPKAVFPPEDNWLGIGSGSSEAFVGTGKGYHWYGRTVYPAFCDLQKEFDLISGESLYAAAVAYCRRNAAGQWWSAGEMPTRNQTGLADSMRFYAQYRSTLRNPIPKQVVDAGAILEGSRWEGYGTFGHPSPEIVEKAKKVLVDASRTEPDAAAGAALVYAFRYACRGPRRYPDNEGIALLNRLPRDAVVDMLETLLKRINEPREGQSCRKFLDVFRKSTPGAGV